MSDAIKALSPSAEISQVEKLTQNHVVKKFKCGKHSLDLFLKRYALKNQQADSSQTYVVHRDSDVIGYYSLTVGAVDKLDSPPNIALEMPPDYPIPVILLARLAVAQTEKGRGLGKALMKHAFYQIVSAAEIVGARAVLVHAIDPEAKAYYERYDFEAFPLDSLRLFLSLKDIRAAVPHKP